MRNTAEQDTAQGLGRRDAGIVVITEVGRRSSPYGGGYDLAIFAENYLLDISLGAGFISYMGIAVIPVVLEFGRVGADEYLAQTVARRRIGADADVDAVRPLPNMPERIFDPAIARNLDRSVGSPIFFQYGVGYLARSIAEFIRVPAWNKRIVTVKSVPIRRVGNSVSEAALCIAVAVF